MKIELIAASTCLLLVLPGCGSTNQRPAPVISSVESHYGVVTSVSTLESGMSKGPGAGAVIGGVVGGVLGNQVGKGNGNTAATIAGALGGAYVGDKVQREDAKKRPPVYAVEVRFNSGDYSTVTLADGSFREGDRVELRNGALLHR